MIPDSLKKQFEDADFSNPQLVKQMFITLIDIVTKQDKAINLLVGALQIQAEINKGSKA